jgi:hypothetical protein
MKNQQHPLIHIFQARQGDQKLEKKLPKQKMQNMYIKAQLETPK